VRVARGKCHEALGEARLVHVTEARLVEAAELTGRDRSAGGKTCLGVDGEGARMESLINLFVEQSRDELEPTGELRGEVQICRRVVNREIGHKDCGERQIERRRLRRAVTRREHVLIAV